MLAVDTLVERLGYLDRIEKHVAQIVQKIEPQISADHFLRSRNEMIRFEESLQQGEEIWLAGRSLFTLPASYGRDTQNPSENLMFRNGRVPDWPSSEWFLPIQADQGK